MTSRWVSRESPLKLKPRDYGVQVFSRLLRGSGVGGPAAPPGRGGSERALLACRLLAPKLGLHRFRLRPVVGYDEQQVRVAGGG